MKTILRAILLAATLLCATQAHATTNYVGYFGFYLPTPPFITVVSVTNRSSYNIDVGGGVDVPGMYAHPVCGGDNLWGGASGFTLSVSTNGSYAWGIPENISVGFGGPGQNISAYTLKWSGVVWDDVEYEYASGTFLVYFGDYDETLVTLTLYDWIDLDGDRQLEYVFEDVLP